MIVARQGGEAIKRLTGVHRYAGEEAMQLPLAVSITDSLQQGFDAFFAFLPNILAFLVILLVGFIVARLIKAIVTKGLQKLKVDQKLDESDARQYVDRVMPDASPSN